LPTRIGQPIEHLAHGYTSEIASPIYSTAVGLLSIAINNMESEALGEDVFDLNETEEQPIDEAEDGFLGKLFTYTKEFFAASEDSNL